MIAALFVRSDSVYKRFPGVDCFDETRDARTFAGGVPVVAHPPCRGWGRLRHFAKVKPGELDLGRFAVACVRRNGGVLEHPAGSLLWPECGLPFAGDRDHFGGFTVPVLQSWFGHRAPKSTWLYVCGVSPRDIPAFPFELGIPPGRVELMGRSERESTPVEFAQWLVELARTARGVA